MQDECKNGMQFCVKTTGRVKHLNGKTPEFTFSYKGCGSTKDCPKVGEVDALRRVEICFTRFIET